MGALNIGKKRRDGAQFILVNHQGQRVEIEKARQGCQEASRVVVSPRSEKPGVRIIPMSVSLPLQFYHFFSYSSLRLPFAFSNPIVSMFFFTYFLGFRG